MNITLSINFTLGLKIKPLLRDITPKSIDKVKYYLNNNFINKTIYNNSNVFHCFYS